MDSLASAHPGEVHALIRKGQWTEPTAGLSNGYAQANLVILPQAIAMKVKPDFMITHAPGHMFISDIRNEELSEF